MNLAHALENGYRLGRTAYERGYISRRLNVSNQPVKYNRRSGEPYVEVPAFNSTKFFIRQYLVKEEAGK